ncbi:AraC-like DNA-binding protein [Spirosoma lacussanchae]|uniref:AraC family transcriptional regulator n=1 Tax=Spirosoma lacussanchae TaxID=1884249 RepID=UPI001108650C|nr:AraC family transcriptional regulator [Spirosoma lacussanchae]
MLKKQEGFTGQRSASLPVDVLTQMAAHPLCESLYITDIGYYPKAAFHDRERRSGCPQHILIYCVQGEGWCRTGASKYAVTANQFFILPADISHAYGADQLNPWTIYWIHFTGTRSAHFLTFLQQEPGPVTVLARDERFSLFEDIIAHVEMSFNEDSLVYANNSLAHFLTTFKTSVYNPDQDASASQDPVSRTITYMKQHLSQSLTLDELAGVANMSASHYSALFRQKVQSAPINFFTYLKMQKACQLLKYSHLRIKEVAYQVGYSDPYHFSRVFTGVMGIPPRDFRRKETT